MSDAGKFKSLSQCCHTPTAAKVGTIGTGGPWLGGCSPLLFTKRVMNSVPSLSPSYFQGLQYLYSNVQLRRPTSLLHTHILLPSIFTTIPAQPAGVSMISLQCDKSAHISNVINIKQQQYSFLERIVIIRKMDKRLCLFVLCCNGRGGMIMIPRALLSCQYCIW